MIYRFNSARSDSKVFRLAGILVFTLGFWSPTNAALAQGEAFDTIQFELAGGPDMVKTQLHETWSIPGVVELGVSTPFYVGEAKLNATYLPASSRSAEVTDFWAIYAGAGLAFPIPLNDRIKVSPEVRFGSMYMNFADETVDFRKEESEIFVGGRLALSAAVTHRTAVEISTVFHHTFTGIPINVSVINVGLQYRIETPGWLKRVLQ